MFAMVSPLGRSLRDSRPLAVEVKRFQVRIALFWLFYPTQDKKPEAVLGSKPLRQSALKAGRPKHKSGGVCSICVLIRLDDDVND